MGNLLYTIAVILVIIWALGFFGVLGTGIATGGLIHILLVIAKRKTVTAMDVVYALKRQGRTLYGFGS